MQAPIYFDSRWNGDHGIGRFARELQDRLPGLVPLRIIGAKLSPIDPVASSLALAGRNEGCFLTPGFNAPLRSPIPFAFTIHDLIHLRVPGESSLVRRVYYATVVRPAARKAHRILTVSEHSRRDIIEWADVPEESVSVVGNGVSALFAPGPAPAPSQPYFLHVGRRASHKNIPRLLAAFAASRARDFAFLTFTGTPDAPTVAEARRLGIADRLRFAGGVSDTELALLYRGALALVFPSVYEGFGLPIVEAMSCGTPVITSRATSTAEVAGEGNALLVDPSDAGELASALDAAAGDAQLRARLIARGLERARAFSWERVAARVQSALGV